MKVIAFSEARNKLKAILDRVVHDADYTTSTVKSPRKIWSMSDRKLAWTDKVRNDYLYWQSQDKKTLKRINKLIQATKSFPAYILSREISQDRNFRHFAVTP